MNARHKFHISTHLSHTHHHHRLTSFFRATARVRRFPRMPLLHTARSCVSSTQSFNLDMSSSTHSIHVFLGLPCPLPFILSTTLFLHAIKQNPINRLLTFHMFKPSQSTTFNNHRDTLNVQSTQQFRTCLPISQSY